MAFINSGRQLSSIMASANCTTGGIRTVVGNRVIHTFLTTGQFVVNDTSCISGNVIDYLVIAGGGGGNHGGAGAGGYRNSYNNETSGANSASESAVTVTQGATYQVNVGGGGVGGATGTAVNGDNSSIIGTGVNVVSLGGGFGGARANSTTGATGGSGGGSGNPIANGTNPGTTGTAGQGFGGGSGTMVNWNYGDGGGGGGAGGAGSNGPQNRNDGGNGGLPLQSSISGTATYYAGGGGGGNIDGTPPDGTGGFGGMRHLAHADPGGGGDGGGFNAPRQLPMSGLVNTGGGGGGKNGGGYGGISGVNGGSGIVIISYTLSVPGTMELTFHPKIQGNLAWPHIPVHGGSPSQAIETTLTSLPEFQVGETITGGTNSYTATVTGITSQGTSELATCVGGGCGAPGQVPGYGGGSGGGGSSNDQGMTGGGLAVAGQGFPGGMGGDRQGAGNTGSGGGGGGAGGAGANGGSNHVGANGGVGKANNFRTGIDIMYAGGGGGFGGTNSPGTGGAGGGGTGGDGAVNTGGGGGNKALNVNFSQGGSGIVVVRYVTGQSGFTVAGGLTNTYTLSGTDYQSHTFLSTGVLTITGTGNVDALIISGGGAIGVTGGPGYCGGGGGAGGMLETNNTPLAAGSYVVVVGAGGGYSQGGGITGFEGNMGRDGGTGNLSYITPRRILTFENQSGNFVVGEALNGGTSGATGDVLAI